MSDLDARKSAWNEAVTELAEEYASKLQDIYEKRTAGDFTFLGVLGEYTQKLDQLRAKRPSNGMTFIQHAGVTPPPRDFRKGGPAEMAMLVQKSRELRRNV